MSFYTYANQIGNRILHRWIDDDGERHMECTDFDPSLYVNSGDGEYRGIRGENLQRVHFDSIKESRDFIKKHDDITNFPIHGNQSWWAQFLQQEYTGKIDWDMSKLVIANIDIEVLMNDPDNPGLNPVENPIAAVNRITAITVEVDGEFVVFGSKPYPDENLPHNAKHYYFGEEGELLYAFLHYWSDINPDVVTGWNIAYFDIPYLIGRIRKIMGDESVRMLGPAGSRFTKNVVGVREFTSMGQDQVEVSIMGLSIMDYLQMYKKFTYKMRERYSLDFVAYVELGERKLDYSEYGNLDSLYEQNYKQYIDYNIRDVHLVNRLDQKLNLMMLVLTLTYMCHIRHEDVFSQVRMWDTLIYNTLLEKNVVIPPKQEFSKSQKYEGAYVRDPEIGMHEWVVSFDLNSLYPHLIMQYNISPEMLVDREIDENVMFTIDQLVSKNVDLSFLKEENLSMTANKAFFRRDDQGFLAAIMDQLYKQRKVVKKKMLEVKSDAELIKAILKERGDG